MKSIKLALVAMVAVLSMAGCKSWNKSQKGAVIGAAGGAAVGGVIGKAAKNPALGAIIGATVGGAAGAIIGHQMDKQAEEIKNELPDAKVERVGEGIVVEFNNKILFGFDSYALTDASKKSLDELRDILNKYSDTNIEVQGHTDNSGSDDYNLSLSQKRAEAVAAYLRSNGISSSRVTTKGFGEAYPKYSNDNETDKAMNRRVEFLISANSKMQSDAQKEATKP
jgi:outer membrane protein OmpA-like peptidoglycan-associated protein